MILETTCYFEEIILFKKGKANSNKKHLFQRTYIIHVSFCHPEAGEPKVGKDSKEFPFMGDVIEENPYLISWLTVYVGQRKGGLGIRTLSMLNKALLGN